MKLKTGAILCSITFVGGLVIGKSFITCHTNRYEFSLAKVGELLDGEHTSPAELAQVSDSLSQMINSDPKNIRAMFLLARINQRRGFIDKALSTYEQVIPEMISERWASHFNAGTLYEAKGNLASAENHFFQAMTQAPAEINGWDKLIRVLEKQGKHSEAKDYYTALKELFPGQDLVGQLKADFKY